jgi:hypothetical protein
MKIQLTTAFAALWCCGEKSLDPFDLSDVPPQHRGKTWAVAGQLFTIINMKGVPPYISPSYTTFENAPRVPQ